MSYIRQSARKPNIFQREIFAYPTSKFGFEQVGDQAFGTAGITWVEAIEVTHDCVVSGILVYIGGVAAGNVTCGITVRDTKASPAPDGLALLAVTASTALTGTARMQHVPFIVGSIQLKAGIYWVMCEGSAVADKLYYSARSNEILGDGWDHSRWYLRGGGVYGALTDPVPATTGSGTPAYLGLKVVSTP